MFICEERALFVRHQGETLRIEPWGKDSLRIRATMYPRFSGENWALSEKVTSLPADISVSEDGSTAEIRNGRISIVVNAQSVMKVLKDGRVIFQEYFRNYEGTLVNESRCLKYINREYTPYVGGDYRIVQKFDSDPHEKIFGMGQYQQANTDLKGCILDLEQRNSQVSVPFMISSKGYGLLLNTPAVGRVSFGMNITEFRVEAVKELDYWVTVGDTPKQLLKNYTDVSGRASEFPEDLMGLWQCKLRYRSQEEVLSVGREYKKRSIPLDAIVIDFFHWPYQGDWRFDQTY